MVSCFPCMENKNYGHKVKIDACRNKPLQFNGHIVETVDSHVHLGIRFTKNMRWNEHIQDIATKSRRKLNALLPLKFKFDRKSLEQMYKSFVQPCMEYGNVVWGGTYKSDLDKLEKIQVDSMRLITGATARSHVNLLYRDTCLITTHQRTYNCMLTMMWKIRNGICPTYLADLMPPARENERYNLRNRPEIQPPFARLESHKRSFIPFTCRLWNDLPAESHNAISVAEFKTSLKTNVQKPDPLFYYGERWPAVHHARLRLGCSKLNADLYFNLHVVDKPECSCGAVEDANHFFLQCRNYINPRQLMFESLAGLANIKHLDITCDILLYGSPNVTLKENEQLFQIAHDFISASNRFV